MNEREVLNVVEHQTNVGQFYEALLPKLMEFVGADVGLLESGSALASLAAPSSVLERSGRQRYAAELKPVFDVARCAGVAVDTLTLGVRKVRGSRYYNEVVRPHDGSETLFAFPTMASRATSLLLLGRNRGSPRFKDRDIDRVRGLLPAIAVATRALQAPVASVDVRLSRREEEILAYLRSGCRSAEIASLLGTSVNTVRNQISRLMNRVGVSTRAELVALLP